MPRKEYPIISVKSSYLNLEFNPRKMFEVLSDVAITDSCKKCDMIDKCPMILDDEIRNNLVVNVTGFFLQVFGNLITSADKCSSDKDKKSADKYFSDFHNLLLKASLIKAFPLFALNERTKELFLELCTEDELTMLHDALDIFDDYESEL